MINIIENIKKSRVVSSSTLHLGCKQTQNNVHYSLYRWILRIQALTYLYYDYTSATFTCFFEGGGEQRRRALYGSKVRGAADQPFLLLLCCHISLDLNLNKWFYHPAVILGQFPSWDPYVGLGHQLQWVDQLVVLWYGEFKFEKMYLLFLFFWTYILSLFSKR